MSGPIKPNNYFSYNIMLTSRCFLNCSHCLVTNGKVYKQSVIDTGLMKALVDKAMSLSESLELGWGGGDPLVLGREYLRKIVRMECFDQSAVKNTIYTTLLLKDFDGWPEILDRFNSMVFSFDSYRQKERNFDEALCFRNLSRLSLKKTVSYTPHMDDDVETYYRKAADIGADRFHLGFVYEHILPADFYIRTLERLCRIGQMNDGPEIGFFGSDVTGRDMRGWTGFSCFTSGVFISPDSVMTSCVPLYLKNPGDVPHMTVEAFLDRDDTFDKFNGEFIRKVFFQNIPGECVGCPYHPHCMRGCPYFSAIGGGKDIYCSVYREIFKFQLGEI